jgi:DNA-directed RNA polymerase specialized sigma24 family protein
MFATPSLQENGSELLFSPCSEHSMTPPVSRLPALQREGEIPIVSPASVRAGASAPTKLSARLNEFETTTQGRALERVAESEIILLLQLQKFDPHTPEWKTLRDALIEYGYAVLKAWCITGAIKSIAARARNGQGVMGVGKIPDGLRLNEDDAHALAAEVIIVAVENFRTKTLLDPNRTWRSTGGASIKTYFIGRVLMEFPDGYRTWRNANRSFPAANLLDNDDAEGPANTEQAVIAALEADEALANQPVLRRIFELSSLGYTVAEIADMLTAAGATITETTIYNRISRFREKLAQANAVPNLTHRQEES